MANNLDDYKPRKTSKGYPWIKLRTNLVDDPRYMRLSDMAKVAYFEAYILAGKSDAGGLVLAGDDPANTQDLAWLLRKVDADVESALAELARAGLVDMQDGQVTVCRFASEQGPGMADQRKEWVRRQRESRANAKGEILPDTEPEPDESKEKDADVDTDVVADVVADVEKNQESSSNQELKNQTQTKRVQKNHSGVTRDNEFDEGFDDSAGLIGDIDRFAELVLVSWKAKTGKIYKPGPVFYDMVVDWSNAGVQLRHVLSAIDQTSGKADTPIYLRNIAIKIKDNDPQMVATKRLDKFKEMAKDLQDGD